MSDDDRTRRQAAVEASGADAEPMTPEQMQAVVVEAMREAGATDPQLWAAGLLSRPRYLTLRGRAIFDEVRLRVNARAEQTNSQMAQRCAWFERQTRVDPRGPRADITSARYLQGNKIIHEQMRELTGPLVDIEVV